MNKIPIVYENEDIYIINKPSGLASQGGKGLVQSVDVNLEKQVGKKVHLVHRLDKDTEGLLVVAKNPQSAHTWTSIISSKEIQKEYYAICLGSFRNKSGEITQSIDYKGIKKTAFTRYSIEKTILLPLKQDDINVLEEIQLSLVKIQLGSGRMHQIRIHLSQNGNPIVADDKYGDFKLNKLLKKQHGIKKLHLAACKLEIPHKYLSDTVLDKNNKKTTFSLSNPLSITIEIPNYMQKTLQVSSKTY